MALRRPCRCDHCLYPLVVSSIWRWPLQRDSRATGYPFSRAALNCAITPPNLFDFKQIRSGCVDKKGGYSTWQMTVRDFEAFLDRYGLGSAYREGGIFRVLREIGLTRMQTEAFMLCVGSDFTQARAAAVLGVTQGAISQRLDGARERLDRWQKDYRKRNLIVLELVRPIDERQDPSLFLPAS